MRDFAWDQWTRLGVSGPRPSDPEHRAADPEALLLFTFEAARDDPRLFDEVLDWLVRNEQLVSVQRLRNLCVDDEDRLLVDASLGWVAQWRPRQRLAGRRAPGRESRPEQLLFPGLSRPHGKVDEAFAAFGFLRPPLEPSGKSQRPDLHAPIAFAFQLRRLLGIGVRAEIVRALLTIDAPRVSAGVLYAAAGFTRQNVRESVQQLAEVGVLRTTRQGSDQFYALHRADWAVLLGTQHGLPLHRDWIQTLGPLRLILRWLRRSEVEALSEYMRASEARQLIADLEQDLRFAGFAPAGGAARGASYWDEFVDLVRAALAALYV